MFISSILVFPSSVEISSLFYTNPLSAMSPASFLVDGNFKPTSLSGLWFIVFGATILYFLYLSGSAIYNVYFHPLRAIPGPKTWVAFPFFFHLAAVRGLADKNIRSFHEKYGEAVR